jgi:hypothetical protein
MSLPDIGADAGNVPEWVAGVLLLAGTVSVAGIIAYVLINAGYGTLGTLVWAGCYVTAMLVIWVVWLQDIELTGPAG